MLRSMECQGGLEPVYVREFEVFFSSTRRRTLHAVLPLVRDLGEAEDVLQVAYERAAVHWTRIRDYDDPAGWVRRVAYNEAINWLRRARRQLVDYRPDVTDLGGRHIDSYEHDTPDLLLALRRLNHRDRVVLTLRYVWRFSVEEIADELAVNPNTVKARLARARRRLGDLASDGTVGADGAAEPQGAGLGRDRTMSHPARTPSAHEGTA